MIKSGMGWMGVCSVTLNMPLQRAPLCSAKKTKTCLCELYTFLIQLTQIGPALHQGCNAFSEEAECSLSNLTQSKKEKKRRSGQTRVVGGQASTDPIPWLVSCLVVIIAMGNPSN